MGFSLRTIQAALKSWVATLAGFDEDASAILATGASAAAPQTFSGAALNGWIGTGEIAAARPIELVLSAHANWTGGNASVTGTDETGATRTEALAIPVGGGATIKTQHRYVGVTSIALDAQGGTAGTFTVGLAAAGMVIWQNEMRPRTNVPLAVLSWVSSVPVGVDETRWSIDGTVVAPGLNATAQTIAQRVMTLQVGFEAFEQLDAVNSRQYAESFRERVFSQSSIDTLVASSLGVVDATPAQQSDYRDGSNNGRWISRALVEVRINVASLTTDRASQRGTIDHAQITSQLTDPSGALLPSAEQLNNVEMP